MIYNFYILFLKKKKNIVVTYNIKNYKVDSLEWTINSPPELHTFVVSPKIFTTSYKYISYKFKKDNESISAKKNVFFNEENSQYFIYKNVFSYHVNKNIHPHFFSFIWSKFKNNMKVSVFFNSKVKDTNITVQYNYWELISNYLRW